MKYLAVATETSKPSFRYSLLAARSANHARGHPDPFHTINRSESVWEVSSKISFNICPRPASELKRPAQTYEKNAVATRQSRISRTCLRRRMVLLASLQLPFMHIYKRAPKNSPHASSNPDADIICLTNWQRRTRARQCAFASNCGDRTTSADACRKGRPADLLRDKPGGMHETLYVLVAPVSVGEVLGVIGVAPRPVEGKLLLITAVLVIEN